MARGKTIQLYLMDSVPKGRIKCTLANWTGIAYKIPRTELEKAKSIDYLKQSGVYFLFSTSDETQENIVYIGQAGTRKNGEGILNRLQEHKRNPDKDYWTEAVAFTTTNNTFGPTEISYLENQFTKLAIDSKRYIVKNSNEPSLGHVTEEKESELEEYIDYAKIVIGALGYRIFEPIIESPEIITTVLAPTPEPLLSLILNQGKKEKIIAHGKQTNEGFVILKGSKIKSSTVKSVPTKALKDRKRANLDDNFVLLEDMLFNSPSSAASFVTGYAINGKDAWKDEQGRSLNEIEKLE
ncbi:MULTISPECIES: GIY-YIG nuclease family protein [Lactobacillales]|uniref:GIY-YIG nuclease family protein n=1 Tax=Lactobacillales TaxID=186826 RepID=UPI000BB4B2D8|nr:GIY-YIG nuclease family protein [Lactococcus raffinolactis]ATC62244.1 methionine sulfoxide reductase [Lactococcus raffinolactis]MDG4960957.1 GIY-YIG nuclease family protein [Lactococcus raffinolactis]